MQTINKFNKKQTSGYVGIALALLTHWQAFRKPFGIGNATAVGNATGRASAEADEEEGGYDG